MSFYDTGEAAGAVQYYYEEEPSAFDALQESGNDGYGAAAAYEMTEYVADEMPTSPVQSTTTDSSSSYLLYDYDGEASRSDLNSETTESFVYADPPTPPPVLERQEEVYTSSSANAVVPMPYIQQSSRTMYEQPLPPPALKRGKKKRYGPYETALEFAREQLTRNRLAAMPNCDLNEMMCLVDTCRRRFDSITVLAFHMSYSHTDSSGGPISPLMNTCLLCGAELINVRGKLAHMTSKHREVSRLHSESCVEQHAFSLRGSSSLLQNSRTVPRNPVHVGTTQWTMARPVMRRIMYTSEDRSSSGQSSRSSSSLSSWPML
ncbi:hypothetical protein AAVH_30699 [Aphelenchoides avenae]|nr:hypothetical protein AAVH_30699 [Aphelenchus avenae]